MNSNFLQEMVTLRDQLAAEAEGFNTSSARLVRSLIVCKRQDGKPVECFEVLPKPVIDTVNPNLVAAYGQNQNIQIELDSIQVNGISRNCSPDQLVGTGIYYAIDAELVDGAAVGGFEAEVVPGTGLQEKGLTWELILRRRRRAIR